MKSTVHLLISETFDVLLNENNFRAILLKINEMLAAHHCR